MDVWVLDREVAAKMNMASWVPVDHKPVPFGVANFFQATGAVPIAMSRFGQEQLREVNLDPLYVPHGVDTNIYRPHDRAKVRESVGAPQDAFLIGAVAANKGRPSRKGFQQMLEAFAIFREKHDEALLYLHTVTDADYAGGEDIMSLARALGVSEYIVVPPRYQMMYDPLPAATMAQVYSAMDVLLNPAMGEGFGIPVLEAAACGVPSIVTDFTAMPEVAGDAGWKVSWRPYWTPGKAWWGIADTAEIVHNLEVCYGQTDVEKDVRAMELREHAMEYDAEKVMEDYWLPALEVVEERYFGDRKPSVSKTKLAA
jgi:glycosyltransferase involved in cell wall biosynthesis